jgi:hypothetical protein
MALGFLAQILAPTLATAQAGRAAKANQGPRALGLLVLQPNGKAQLIPITILIDGQYYDASAFKASPVPMALWSETVYEALRTGVSQGLFTVTGALQQKGAKDANEWMGEGTWQSAESLKAKAVKKPEYSEPRGLNQDEGPPVLRRSGAEKPKPTETPAPPAAPPVQPAPTGPPNAAPAATGQPAPATTASASAQPGVPSQTAKPQEDRPPEDKDRPVLQRGKPAPQRTDKHEKASATATKAAGHTATAPPSQSPAVPSAPRAQAANQVQLIPAISDSHARDPIPYTFSMKPDEEQQFRNKMLAMAAGEVRAHAGQLSPGGAEASQPVRATSQRSKATAVKPAQPIFEDVQLRVFDLANINEPELVLTANARMPQPSREKEIAGSELHYAVTLVAREDVNGDFHKALANVTDAQHLDVLPRLELIDAVDADGDGRGELLFRQVSDAGSGFVVYRVIGDRLYPLFQGALGR